MKKTFGIINIINEGDDPIHVGDMIHCCPCCDQLHSTTSDCKQGVRP